MKWVIQDIFGDETKELCKYIKDYKVVKYPDIEEGITAGEPLIVRGSIDFVDSFYKRYLDSSFPCLDEYNCSNYYKYFGPRLLNDDHIFMPWGLLSINKELIHSIFKTDSLFIRPDSGRKIFTGTTLTKKWWGQELNIIQSLPGNSVTDNDIVVISTVKHIESEYRVLMYRNEILGYSHYDGQTQRILKTFINLWGQTNSFFPDDLYTMDLAWTKDSVKLVELNSFYSSGLYDMDFKHIVERIEEIYATKI